MLGALFLLSLPEPTFAENSTTVGWKFNDNTRSTWDLIWQCFSTILLCTWTVLCLDVPPRNQSDTSQLVFKIRMWLVALACPELIAIKAVREFFLARDLAAACN